MLPKLRPDLKIGIIGLGYVGLPLALAFSEKYRVIGYDLDEKRVDSLQKGKDLTLQVSEADLNNSKLVLTSDYNHLTDCAIYIITVPTPVDEQKKLISVYC